MDFELTAEQSMLKDLCRDFARKEIAPYADEWFDAEYFPVEIFRKMADLKLMGLLIPEEYGGTNAGTTAMVAALEELGKVDQSIATTLQAHLTIGSLPFLHFGSEGQKQQWLAPLARGERLGAFGLTEPQAGSDAANIQTTAHLDGDSWVVNGTKCFISNAGTPLSYGLVALTTSGKTDDGKKRYSAIIIPKGTPGYTIGKPYKKIGWHTVDTREQIFDNVRVPRENLLGQEGGGFRAFLKTLECGRISVATLGLSLAEACLEMSVKYALGRKTFGKPLASHQAIQFKLADMATQAEMAKLMSTAPPGCATRAGRLPPRRRWRSWPLLRSPSGRRKKRCRSTAATATRASSRSRAFILTRRFSPSARAPAKCSAWSLPGSWAADASSL